MLIDGGWGVGTTWGSVIGGSDRSRSAEAPTTRTRKEQRATIAGEREDRDRAVFRLGGAAGMRFLFSYVKCRTKLNENSGDDAKVHYLRVLLKLVNLLVTSNPMFFVAASVNRAKKASKMAYSTMELPF